jgi:hemoglobin/transferrin/lactoferrin receptor protein
MKHKIIIAFIAVFVFKLNAQVVTVVDKVSGEKLESVTISSENPKAITATNSLGKADLKSFTKSKNIVFRHLGFKSISKSYEEIEKSDFKVYLEYSNITLDQIVVSSSKWSQSNTEVTSKVIKVTPRKIALQNPQTTADMLTSTGEVFIQKSQQGGGSPMIRGFATNRLLISVDGVRMNTAIFRSGNIQNVISLDNFALQNVEVLFGPGSVMYGSDAIGGVMSFYTLNPQFSLDDNIFVNGNTVYRNSSANSEYTGHFDFNLGWKKLAMLTSVTYSDFGDVRMGNFGPSEYLRNNYVERQNDKDIIINNSDPLLQISSKYNQINLMQKLSYMPNNNWYIDYGFHYSTTSNYNRFDRLLRYRNGLPRSAEWYYGPQIWMMNNLSITNNYSNLFFDNSVLRIAHQKFEESRHDRDFNKSTRSDRFEKVNAFSVNLDFNKNITETTNIVYGVEYIHNDVASIGKETNVISKISATGPSRYPQSKWQSLAAYFDYKNNLSSNLIFELGGRYSYYMLDSDFDTTFYPLPFINAEIGDGAFSGNTGIIYNPDTRTTISLNLSTGFRSPNVDDLGKVFDSEPGSVVVPNPDLKAEYAYNIDLGIAKIIGDFVKIDLTGFYTFLDNAMVRRDFTLNGLDSINYSGEMSKVQAIQNAANATVWGIQGGIDLDLTSGFGFSVRANYQKGEEELDDGSKSPLRHAAPLFGSANLTYSSKKIRLDLYALANGEVSYENMPEEEKGKDYMYATDANGNPYSPSWYTINLKIEYKFENNFSVGGGIENITDQRYRPYSSGMVSAGRNFILSLKLSY